MWRGNNKKSMGKKKLIASTNKLKISSQGHVIDYA